MSGLGFRLPRATSPAINQLIGSQAYNNGTYGIIAAASTNMVVSGNSFFNNTTANCSLGSATVAIASNNYPANATCNNIALSTLGGTGASLPAALGSGTAPTVATGFCSTGSPVTALSANNGTAAFDILIGQATCTSTGTLTMPAATTGWVCSATDVTTPASHNVVQTGTQGLDNGGRSYRLLPHDRHRAELQSCRSYPRHVYGILNEYRRPHRCERRSLEKRWLPHQRIGPSRQCRQAVNRAAAKAVYEELAQVGVPWHVIAVIHEREASQDWAGSLAQGDRWDRVSVNEPKGRGPFHIRSSLPPMTP